MGLIDLTLPVSGREHIRTRELKIANKAGAYTGVIHDFRHDSMAGTYIDFPSHVRETDDGSDASNYPPDKLFRIKAAVIHLDRQDGSGRVGADELAAVFDTMNQKFKQVGPDCQSGRKPRLRRGLRRGEDGGTSAVAETAMADKGLSRPTKYRRPNSEKIGALIINALGKRRFDEVAARSVYLGKDAVNWIISQEFHLLISDIYESDLDPQNVFPDLFRKGIATVCFPVNLHRLTEPEFRVTVLFPRFAGATQLPCRALVETGCQN